MVKTSIGANNLKTYDIISAASLHIAMAVLGFICSRTVISDKLLPFGMSFISGASLTYTPAAAIGVFVGYFIPATGVGGFRYIAAILAVVAVKLLLSGYVRLTEKPVFLMLLCLVSNLLTSLVSIKGIESGALGVTIEVILSTVGTFFVYKSFKILSRTVSGLAPDELAVLFITAGIILAGTSSVSISGISLQPILSFALILLASKYGGIVSGVLSGVSIAFSAMLTGVSGELCIIYAFTGFISGSFAFLGRYAQGLVAVIFAFVGGAVSGNVLLIAKTVIEASLGAAIFLTLPRKAGIFLGKLFSVAPTSILPLGFKKSLTMRLDVAANALSDVSETVEQVSSELSKINSPDFSEVISSVERDSCTGCKLRIHCWENKREETLDAILEMTKAIKQGSSADSGTPDEFKGRCLKPTTVSDAVYKHYSNYASAIAAENRIEEVRSVISDQFGGISTLLSELSADIEKDGQFDNQAAEAAATALKNLNIIVDECSSRTDKYGRMCIELKIKKDPELVINRLQIMKLISIVCERDFDIPAVTELGDSVFITLNEHASLKVEVGAEQISASGSMMCGDAYKYFFDGRGHFTMVLSDGMGTGGRAAVDGAMASGLMSRLLKAGFGYDCSLKILNSSMLFKSTDESLATIDIASIDLYTGQVELCKAGAAPTIIRRSGRTGKAESASLPAGILREIHFDKASIKCKAGDIIVLMSDGASSEGVDWIRDETEAWTEGSAQSLAEKLCEGARRRRTDNHQDDITVITAIIKEAV